jgi:hypothetical protein
MQHDYQGFQMMSINIGGQFGNDTGAVAKLLQDYKASQFDNPDNDLLPGLPAVRSSGKASMLLANNSYKRLPKNRYTLESY